MRFTEDTLEVVELDHRSHIQASEKGYWCCKYHRLPPEEGGIGDYTADFHLLAICFDEVWIGE